MASACAYLGHQ